MECILVPPIAFDCDWNNVNFIFPKMILNVHWKFCMNLLSKTKYFTDKFWKNNEKMHQLTGFLLCSFPLLLWPKIISCVIADGPNLYLQQKILSLNRELKLTRPISYPHSLMASFNPELTVDSNNCFRQTTQTKVILSVQEPIIVRIPEQYQVETQVPRLPCRLGVCVPVCCPVFSINKCTYPCFQWFRYSPVSTNTGPTMPARARSMAGRILLGF